MKPPPRTCVKMEPFVVLAFFPQVYIEFFASKLGVLPFKRSVWPFFCANFRKEFPSRNFRKGPSWNCPFSKLCAVPLALQNRAFFEGEKREKCAERFGGRKGQMVNLASKTPKQPKSLQNKGKPNKTTIGLITAIGLKLDKAAIK